MPRLLIVATALVWMAIFSSISFAVEPQPPIVKAEFIYEKAPFPSCHASTIAETPSGLVAAWFGGKDEGADDVCIWFSRHTDGRWSEPAKVAEGVDEADKSGKRYPCWNPVLYQAKDGATFAERKATMNGPLLLFYKVGPSPSRWWGMLATSDDGGKTWSKGKRLPEGILGPIKNKPVELADGSLLCPTSTEHDGWRVHLERTADLGKAWTATKPLATSGKIEAIQPSVLFHSPDKLQILCRSRQGKLAEAWSDDAGKTWSELKLTELPNPSAGTDAVTLQGGRHVLVYNPVPRGRTPLVVATSTDGKQWKPLATLESESGEYSYPAVIQTADGKLHVTYTWKRQRIKHVVLEVK